MAQNIALRTLFLQHVAQTSDAPLGLEIERAEGLYLYDKTGKKFLDLISGIGPTVLGHRHPAVQTAVEEQLNLYWHTLVYGENVLSPQVLLARALAERLPGLDSVYFVNSGAEATEGAMKLAKRFTGRRRFIACENAYHGSTQGAASLMNPTDFTLPYYPLLPGIDHIRFNQDEDLEKIDRETAAVIVETVQGEAGIIPPRPEWLRALRRRCDDTGALLVLDEIQAGFGRTGRLFAFENYGVVPDILLLGKGFGGGMPLAAFIAQKEVMSVLSHHPVLGHITTFGGHAVCAAAGLATLRVLTETDLMDRVSEKEALFRDLLRGGPMKDLRSAGLWLAVELENNEAVQKVIKHCLKKGVITDWFLFNARSLRIAPPLTIEEEEIRRACEVILEGLEIG